MLCLITQLQAVAVWSGLRVYWAKATFSLKVAFGETSAKMEFATKYFFLLSNHFMANYSVQIIYHLYGDSDGSKRYLIQYDI